LRKNARNRNPVPTQRLEKLRSLYSGSVIPSEDAASPRAEAQRLTDFFLAYYNHVVPFDRRVLEELWGRCDGEECEAGRARAAERLWGLDGGASR
jgi:hypothetical protein